MVLLRVAFHMYNTCLTCEHMVCCVYIHIYIYIHTETHIHANYEEDSMPCFTV